MRKIVRALYLIVGVGLVTGAVAYIRYDAHRPVRIIDSYAASELAAWLPVCTANGTALAYVIAPKWSGIAAAQVMARSADHEPVFSDLTWIKMQDQKGGSVPDVDGLVTHMYYDARARTLAYEEGAPACAPHTD